MDEEEQIMYLYALDFRIAEHSELRDHLNSGSIKPLMSISNRRMLWEETGCPLCWLMQNETKGDMECKLCPAGREPGDNFCKEYVDMGDAAFELGLTSKEQAERHDEVVRLLEEQRGRVVRRQPLKLQS